jgi:soluble lytic murein transglycosylase-like protein/TolA-binding protein
MKQALLLFHLMVLLFSIETAAVVPAEALKIFSIQWNGTDAIRAANYQQALQMLKQDTLDIDTAFYFLKLGLIHARLNNRMTALPYLKLAAQQSSLLAPVAFVIIGDLESSNLQMTNATDAYQSALYKECPAAYQLYIYEKLKLLYNSDSSVFRNSVPFTEFLTWLKSTQPPPVPNATLSIDSITNTRSWKMLDTIFDTIKFNAGSLCSTIENIIQKVPFDSLRLSSLFTIAQEASACGKYDIAEQLLINIEKNGSKSLAAKALNFNAKMALSRNRIDDAVRLFKRFYTRYGPDSDIIMNIARCYRKKGNLFEASRWYDKHILHFPTHSKTQEILWLQAWQKEAKGKYSSAGALYKKIYTSFKSGNRRDESYLRHALCYYRMEKFDSTITVLASFIKKFPSSSLYPAAVFWKGKAYLEKEKDSSAQSCFKEVSEYDPFDYYAFRARAYLSTFDKQNITPELDTTSNMDFALKWTDSISNNQRTKFSKTDSLHYQRAMICASLGFYDLADYFFNAIEINNQDLSSQFKIALFYSACGATAQAFKIMRRLAWKIPLQNRRTAPVGVYMLLYPAFYSSIILDRAKEEDIDPNLVSAVMRQESIFNPGIVSPAGAIGLMQIMPYTAEQLAGDLKIPFVVDSLYKPSYNIRLGTYYLKQLLEKFNDNFVLVLSSYNAGPHNAKKWYDNNKQEEFDLFVEDIEFTETRGYVKKVMGNYWAYQELCRYPGFKQNYFSGLENL